MNNEYYMVRGWFEGSKGMHGGKFYGAVADATNVLKPKRVVLSGEEAQKASELASKQPAVVYPEEIMESYDVGGLNPRERQDTQRMLLDNPEWLDAVRVWAQNNRARVWYKTNPYALFVSSPTGETSVSVLTSMVPGDVRVDFGQDPGQGWQTLNEMVGTGAIAIDTSRLGMPDRGGHGRVDNLGPKKVRTGKNRVGNRLRGFGDKASLPTMNQAGGRRGGNPQ